MTNGKKAFIWFILCVVLFSLGKYGKSCFYNGYGSIGSIRYNLLPISEEILRVDYIIRYGGITATYEEDKIVVKANNKEYINLYSKESGLQYITNSFDADEIMYVDHGEICRNLDFGDILDWVIETLEDRI